MQLFIPVPCLHQGYILQLYPAAWSALLYLWRKYPAYIMQGAERNWTIIKLGYPCRASICSPGRIWEKPRKSHASRYKNQGLNKKKKKKKIIWGVDYPTPAQGGVSQEKSRWVWVFPQQQLGVAVVGDRTAESPCACCRASVVLQVCARAETEDHCSAMLQMLNTHADCPEKNHVTH